MDIVKDTTFIAALPYLPDPPHARGIRHAWSVFVARISAALAPGCRTPHGIGQWVGLHVRELRPVLCPNAKRLPREATIVRALRSVDIAAREQQITRFVTQAHQAGLPLGEELPPQHVSGVALDGKRGCGASTQSDAALGQLVQHGSGATLAQGAVAHKRNERAAVPTLLSGRNLKGRVVTRDALFTHRNVAQTTRAQQRHYLMMVTQNQRTLAGDVELFFQLPCIQADGEPWERIQTISKGHG